MDGLSVALDAMSYKWRSKYGAMEVVSMDIHDFLNGVHHSVAAQGALARIGSWIDDLVFGVR